MKVEATKKSPQEMSLAQAELDKKKTATAKHGDHDEDKKSTALAAPAAAKPAAAKSAAAKPAEPKTNVEWQRSKNTPYSTNYYGGGYNHQRGVNWWDWSGSRWASGIPNQPVKLKDDTPDEIKSHPDYKKLVGRFLGGLFSDKALDAWHSGIHADNIDNDSVNDDKEWEGYYPNELDQETKGYYYGDRIEPPSWFGGWGGAFGNYSKPAQK